jgi:hypothetical protein
VTRVFLRYRLEAPHEEPSWLEISPVICDMPNNALVPTRKSEARLLAAQRERYAPT